MSLETGISQAFWWQSGKAEFQMAEVGIGKEVATRICWLDQLFRGGIQIPEGSSQPLTMLITGPPGSAKTTLALELCFRLSAATSRPVAGGGPFSSLYVSLDAEFSALRYKAKQMGSSETASPNGW